MLSVVGIHNLHLGGYVRFMSGQWNWWRSVVEVDMGYYRTWLVLLSRFPGSRSECRASLAVLSA